MKMDVKPPKFYLSEDIIQNSPMWECFSPVGRFAYGEDTTGQAYWQAPGQNPRGVDASSVEEAKKCATEAYYEAVLSHPVSNLFGLP